MEKKQSNILYEPTKKDTMWTMIEWSMKYTRLYAKEVVFCYNVKSKKPLSPIYCGTDDTAIIPEEIFNQYMKLNILGVFHTHPVYDTTMFSTYDIYTAFIMNNLMELGTGNVANNSILIIKRPKFDPQIIEFMKNMLITVTMDDMNYMRTSIQEFAEQIKEKFPQYKKDIEQIASKYLEDKKNKLRYDYDKWYEENYKKFYVILDKHAQLLEYDV